MKLDLNGDLAEKLKAAVPECAGAIRRASMYDKDNFEIEHDVLGEAGLNALYEIAKANGIRGLMMQITSLRNILQDPAGAGIGNLRAFVAGVQAYIKKDVIDGWLYERDPMGEPMPNLVIEVVYHEADKRNDHPARASISYCRNRRGSFEKKSHSFDLADVQKKTVPEVLANVGMYHETPELKGIYEEHLAKYDALKYTYGEQYVCGGLAHDAERSYETAQRVDGHKMVNDEEVSSKKQSYKVGFKGSTWETSKQVDGVFDTVPMQPYILMFDLRMHRNCWVHIASIEAYKYNPEVKEKLILPELHRDLLEVLTSEMDMLVDDIVGDKTGGTIIMCQGGPGLGKTLTAQCYAEMIERPLYSVASGQLGTSTASVEKALSTVLERASRWKAVLLIDEADTFVRTRGNDIEQNAIVAVFLRVLEAFPGLLFLTTKSWKRDR